MKNQSAKRTTILALIACMAALGWSGATLGHGGGGGGGHGGGAAVDTSAVVAILVGAHTLPAAVAFEGDTAVAARHMAGIEAGTAVAEVTVATMVATAVTRAMADIEADMAGAEASAVGAGAGVAWE